VNQDTLPLETAPAEVRRRLQDGEALSLIDVREADEFSLARIDGSELLPMNTIPANLALLERKADETALIVFCHHGVRSLQVVSWLRRQGIENCQSLTGGIDLWSLVVDPQVPRY